MSLQSAIGTSQAEDGREAGMQAMQGALERTGRRPAVFCLLAVTHNYALGQVVAGARELLGDAPLLGFSTSAALTNGGVEQRSVGAGLLTGEGIQGGSDWWPDYAENGRDCALNMLQGLQVEEGQGKTLLVVIDGISGDAAHLCQAASGGGYAMAGCLAGGEMRRGRTYQAGGRQTGSGGLAAAVLEGELLTSVGAAHGWRPVGATTRLTRVQGQWVRTLDDRPASEVYARWFGGTARDWAFPPLSDLVRLYPLGIEGTGSAVVRSPLRMEVDGSLRMNTVLPEGAGADLLVGSSQACQKAARQAAEQALEGLGGAPPALAIVFVDEAWRTILQLQPGSEIRAVQQVIGENTPILGGYTLGQVARFTPGGTGELLNQHILVVLFGSKTPQV